MDNPFKAKEGQQTCNSCVHYERCAELNKSTEHLDGCSTCKCYESKGDNIQELERMKNTLNAMCTHIDGECDCSCTDCIAQGLVALGIGDKKQAVIEFAENKVKPLIDELVELLFNDDEPDCKVDDCEKGDDIPCGSSICIEENKQVWKSRVDKLVKEICGGEENKN